MVLDAAADFAVSLRAMRWSSIDALFIGVAVIASGSRVAVVKMFLYTIGVDGARIDAVVPLAPWIQLVSIAIGFEALLLHGETRPFDVSSSQSNQRVFLRGGAFFGLQPSAQVLRWRRQSQSLARDLGSPKSLPAMPAPKIFKRKTSVTQQG